MLIIQLKKSSEHLSAAFVGLPVKQEVVTTNFDCFNLLIRFEILVGDNTNMAGSRDTNTTVFLYIYLMYRSIRIRDKNISVRLQENSISIISDEYLAALVTEMPEAATDELVFSIKKEFHSQFNKDFGVADASISVEIWGHVFAEKFADAVKVITPFKLVNALAEKISLHCEVINIGRKDHDRNRFVWDWLAAFKPAIAAILLSED